MQISENNDLTDKVQAHVAKELARISERLTSEPGVLEYAALYAAQQALCWAAQPEAFAPPYRVVMGNEEGGEGCSQEPRHPRFSDTHDHWQLYVPLQGCQPPSADQ